MVFLYRLICLILTLYYRPFRRLRVTGREHIPREGRVIFAPNHTSYQDPFVLAPLILPRRLAFFAKKELFVFPLAQVMRGFGTFPVDRQGDATGAIRSSLDALEHGLDLGLFPEGTRNKSDRPTLPLKRGVALIAAKAGVPVVPVSISGSKGFFSRIRVHFSPPLTIGPAPGQRRISREDYDAFLAELRARIEAPLKTRLTP